MPLTIFNLSKVDYLYIGRDTVVTFAEEPTIDTYHIEIASEEKTQDHCVNNMEKPSPKAMRTSAELSLS